MGKKMRMKWKKLDIVPKETEELYEDKNISLDNQHPFLKSITETGELSEAEQLTGAPIHYNANGFTDHVVPGDSHYYCDYPGTGPVTYVDTPTAYYPPAQYYQPSFYPVPTEPVAPPLQPVQYVPYYYYYPVPAETYHNNNMEQQVCQPPTNTNNNLNLINNIPITNVQTMIEEEMKISSSSSDSSIIHHSNKIIRRRRKKKKLNETELCQDIDSGYLNGPDSSSELTSETELFTDEDNKKTETKKDIDISSQEISLEFGDVKEILEELAMAKSYELTENAQEERKIELKNVQLKQSNPDLKTIVPKEDTSPVKESKSQCLAKEKKETLVSEPKYKLSVTANLSENKPEASCALDKKTRTEKPSKCKNSMKIEQKEKSSHQKSRISNHDNDIQEARKEIDITETGTNVSVLETWTKVKNTKRNKGKEMAQSNQKKPATVKVIKKADSDKNFTKSENNVLTNKIACRPLEEMKSLFFEEKNVEIVDIIQEKETKPKKKEKKANKRQSKVDGKKSNFKSSLHEDSMDSNMIFLNPLYNFEEFLMGKMPEQETSKKTRKSSGPGKITFLDPVFSPLFISDFTPSRSYSEGLGHRKSDMREISYVYGPAEEQLRKVKAINNCNARINQANPVILLRGPQNTFSTNILTQHHNEVKKYQKLVRKTEIPGPRVKYQPATRMGLLGVKRKVVPPKCIVKRFGKF